jgi:hypothetical protein
MSGLVSRLFRVTHKCRCDENVYVVLYNIRCSFSSCSHRNAKMRIRNLMRSFFFGKVSLMSVFLKFKIF